MGLLLVGKIQLQNKSHVDYIQGLRSDPSVGKSETEQEVILYGGDFSSHSAVAVWIGRSTFRVSLLASSSGYRDDLFCSEDGAEISFEMPVIIYKTTRRHIPEDSNN